MSTELYFEPEWVEPGRAAGQELRETWASLEISIGRQNQRITLSRILDSSTGSVRNRIFAPMYPLAEWIVMNWWHLLYEPETTGADRHHPAFVRRHTMVAAGDGYFFPAVSVTSLGSDRENPISEIRFAERKGDTRRFVYDDERAMEVPTETLQQSFSDFVDRVIARLDDRGVEDTELQREWRQLQEIDPETEEFCRYVAAAHHDPNSIDQQTGDQFVRIADDIGPGVWDDFFPNIGFGLTAIKEAAALIHRFRSELGSTDYPAREIEELRNDLARAQPAKPWINGYELAQTVLAKLSLDHPPPGTLGDLQATFGLPEKTARSLVQQADISIDALVGANLVGSPGIIMNARTGSNEGRRFLFCRAMGEYLGSLNGGERIVSSARTSSQKQNRAFAAEFLAPSAVLRDIVSGPVISEVELIEVAERFGVSTMVIEHQLENHRIATLDVV